MKYSEIAEAASRLAGQIVRTPCTISQTLSILTGADLHLKFENQQFTASFKERGALNSLLLLSDEARKRGVVAMSAGNHAQAIAYHGRRLGIDVVIVMPRYTPNAKVEQTRVFGAEVILHGAHFDETLSYTRELADSRNLTLVHPFDDPAVIAGQGTVGIEIWEQCPDVESVVIPVGGGGLISGAAIALKHHNPQVEIVGVQMERFSSAARAFNETRAEEMPTSTIAEGIAVKQPGDRTMPLIMKHVDRMLTVSEDDAEQAVFTLLEIEKTLVEGAGAVSLAAVTCHRDLFADRKTVLLLSGGNIDMMILSSILQRGLARTGRLVRLNVELPDVPGALADLTRVLGEHDSNIMEIDHQRAFGGSSVRTTIVELELQMRGEEQADQLIAALATAGYEASLVR
jgi:threonine dehydratase